MQIIDTRHSRRKSWYLNGLDRDLVVTCADPRGVSAILSLFPDTEPAAVGETLNRLVRAGVLMRQGDRYLTLAIPWRHTVREWA